MLDHFISTALSPSQATFTQTNPEVHPTFFAGDPEVCICPFHRKGHADFLDVMQFDLDDQILVSFLPGFFFPRLVSVIQELSLSQCFPCSCVVTCCPFL